MSEPAGYYKLLKKMYLMEKLGFILYSKFAECQAEGELKNIFICLADNERRTADLLASELVTSADFKFFQQAIMRPFRLIIRLIPNRVLFYVLKYILRKRMFNRWSRVYNKEDPRLWAHLLEHEELQHQLLTPYWNKPK